MEDVKTYTLTDMVFGHRTDRSVTIEKREAYDVQRGMVAGFFLACMEATLDPGEAAITNDELKEIADMSARMATAMHWGHVVELRKDAALLDLAVDVTYN